jgi:hypothetical protein
MMTELEIRKFLIEVTRAAARTGERETAIRTITARWLKDREEAAEEAKDSLLDEFRDGWFQP